MTQKEKDQELSVMNQLGVDVKSVIDRFATLSDSRERIQIKARLPIIASAIQEDIDRVSKIVVVE